MQQRLKNIAAPKEKDCAGEGNNLKLIIINPITSSYMVEIDFY